MHKLYDLKEKLVRELEDYSQNGKYSKEDVELIKYMASAVDHICNIVADAEEEEYSNAMGGTYNGMNNGSYNDGSYNRGGSYRYSRNSYARGRGSNARRDSMGRYSSRGYSRSDGMVDDLRELMQDAPNEQVRKEFQRLIDKVEQMG